MGLDVIQEVAMTLNTLLFVFGFTFITFSLLILLVKGHYDSRK